MTAIAYGACGQIATDDAGPFRTEDLPADLPRFSAGGSDPSPGFVAFAAGDYAVIIDNTGRVVWYHRFGLGPGLNFQPQPNGRFVARPPSADPEHHWIEIDPSGRITRTFGCLGGQPARFHDVIALPDGSVWLLCDETRVMDLSALGGSANARVTGTSVQHVGLQGDLLFSWSPFDHLPLDYLSESDKAATSINWTHGNALDLDPDGSLLLSFRNLDEVVKIDPVRGELVWRLGGRNTQFVLDNGDGVPFSRQHGIRLSGPGEIVLLDNHGEPDGSRAERYAIDEGTWRMRLLASYAPIPAVVAEVGGTTQSLPGGRLLVSFGSGGRVEEYDAAGEVVWSLHGPTGYIFRAQRILSPYDPGRGYPR